MSSQGRFKVFSFNRGVRSSIGNHQIVDYIYYHSKRNDSGWSQIFTNVPRLSSRWILGLFLLSRRRPPDFFFETNARAQRLECHSTRSLLARTPRCPTGGGGGGVEGEGEAWDSFERTSKMAFLSRPFAQPTRINGSEGKSIVCPSPDSQHSSTRCFCSRLLRASTGRYTVTIPATRRGRGLKFHGGCFPEQNRSTMRLNASITRVHH